MICKSCGAGDQTSNFCNKCGVALEHENGKYFANPVNVISPVPTTPGNSFSIGAIICGAV